jgi:hypothetical protein
VTVAVSEALKGDAGGRLTVALPGGIDASRRIPVAMIWQSAPAFAERRFNGLSVDLRSPESGHRLSRPAQAL